MKHFKAFLVLIALALPTFAYANYLDEIKTIILDIKSNKISTSQIQMLQGLDNVASGEQYYNCASDGSLGYGLCVAGGEQYYRCTK